MTRLAFPLLALLLVMSGCWAISDIRENREFDRALAFQTPVRCGPISALTPQVYLLLENRGEELILRVAASPRRYTAKPASREQFSAYLDAARHAGKQVDICATAEGITGQVYLIRTEVSGKVWGEYVTFVQSGVYGIIATYLEWGFTSQPPEETRWTEVPKFFARFIGSLRFERRPNHESSAAP